MKGVMKKLCLLLADTVREQEHQRIQGRSHIGGNPEPKAITDDSNGAMVPVTSGQGASRPAGEESDGVSVATSATPATTSTSVSSSSSSTVSSRFVPMLHRRRIASLPVKSVGSDCPRIRNHRIMVSGYWGTYSGPTLSLPPNPTTESKTEFDNDDDDEDESSEAGILLGCVVRLDDTSLYVGSLSRNDTGSFIFHPPGTLYDSNGKPMRRIR